MSADLETHVWTLEAVAEVLNRFSFVTWDRLGRANLEGWGDIYSIFGWIPRDDSRSDFVNLTFSPWSPKVGSATSSARYSLRIAEILGGADEHHDCERVEDVFGDLVWQRVASR